MLAGAPTNSVGVANRSGWMIKETFLEYLQHFSSHSRCSKEKPVLLLLDNHSSHISLDSVKYSKENGIVMLTFPPHCTHKLQPLDRSVFGPLKAAMNKVQSEWMVSNSGKIMKITHIPAFVNQIYTQVFTQKNICSGFKVTGIHPLNSSIFQESDFAASKIVQPQNSNDIEIESDKSSTLSKITLPIELRPLPSVSLPKEVRKSTRKGRTIILTDTPEMIELEEKELNQKENLTIKSNKANKRALKKIKIENNVLKNVNVIKNQMIEVPEKSIKEKQSLKRKLNNENKQSLKKAKIETKDMECEERIFNKGNEKFDEKLNQKRKNEPEKVSSNRQVNILRIFKTEKGNTDKPANSSTVKRIKINKNIIEEKIKIVKQETTSLMNQKRVRKVNAKFSDFILLD